MSPPGSVAGGGAGVSAKAALGIRDGSRVIRSAKNNDKASEFEFGMMSLFAGFVQSSVLI
jgi:hypothetical protein